MQSGCEDSVTFLFLLLKKNLCSSHIRIVKPHSVCILQFYVRACTYILHNCDDNVFQHCIMWIGPHRGDKIKTVGIQSTISGTVARSWSLCEWDVWGEGIRVAEESYERYRLAAFSLCSRKMAMLQSGLNWWEWCESPWLVLSLSGNLSQPVATTALHSLPRCQHEL